MTIDQYGAGPQECGGKITNSLLHVLFSNEMMHVLLEYLFMHELIV